MLTFIDNSKLLVLVIIACAAYTSADDETLMQSDFFDDLAVEQSSWANDAELTALAQANKLSLVVRYAGTGYDLLKGSPEGDFDRGGIDPGIRKTREIFTHTYDSGKEAYYSGKSMKVPDQVSFHASESCAKKSTVKAYSGRKSYMNELQTSTSISGKNIVSLFGIETSNSFLNYTHSGGFGRLFSFSLSHGK